MRLALQNLPAGLHPDLALIDGLPVYPFPLRQMALVKGDARSASIAAASIVAKVTRDRLMRTYDAHYPGYGFATHKGYGVPQHLRALAELSPCSLHRRSFRPVAELLSRLPDAPE
jgi:ribonuclease HII